MIGERIKELREQNGFTQTALSKKLGLSRSAINAWEMGVSVPSTQYLVELSKLFKVSTDYILGLNKDEKVDISYLNQQEKVIIYAMLNCFKKYHQTVELLYHQGFVRPGDNYEELYDTNFEMPEFLKPTLDNMMKAKKDKENLDD